MLIGVLVIVIVLLALATLLVDRLVPYVPQSWEYGMFPEFERLRHTPETKAETDHQQRLETQLSRLVDHWPEHPDGLRVGLLDNDQPNALAFPGGLILVTTGLVEQVRSENELAFVLGHELGHYRGRDQLRNLGRGVALGMILAAMGQGGSLGDLVALSGQLMGRSFSREQETNADAFGLSLVASQFGHVNGVTDFFEHLPAPTSALERSLATYLATHPLSDERVEAMEFLARERGWPTEGETIPIR